MRHSDHTARGSTLCFNTALALVQTSMYPEVVFGAILRKNRISRFFVFDRSYVAMFGALVFDYGPKYLVKLSSL